jgi:outer membrane protein assembly factor BamB
MHMPRPIAKWLLTILLSFVCVGPVKAEVAASWPDFSYDPGDTGYNPTEKTIGSDNIKSLRLIQTLPTNLQVIDPITTAKGVAFVNSTDDYLYAYDINTGAVIWKFLAHGSMDAPTGVVVQGTSRVFVTCLVNNTDPGLCALHFKTGKLLWTFSYGNNNFGTNPIAPPLLSGNVVYFEAINSGYEQDVIALDATDGTMLWKFGACNNVGICEHFGESSPDLYMPMAVANGKVYAICSGGTGFEVMIRAGICAFDAINGKLRWQRATNGSTTFSAGPGTLYLAAGPTGGPTTVEALNGATGGGKWSTTVSTAANPIGPPALRGAALFVGVDDANNKADPNLIKLDARSGSILRSTVTPWYLGASLTIVAPADGKALLLSPSGNAPRGAIAFDPGTLHVLWTAPSGVGGGPTTTVTGGLLLNVCNFNNVCVYAPAATPD